MKNSKKRLLCFLVSGFFSSVAISATLRQDSSPSSSPKSSPLTSPAYNAIAVFQKKREKDDKDIEQALTMYKQDANHTINDNRNRKKYIFDSMLAKAEEESKKEDCEDPFAMYVKLAESMQTISSKFDNGKVLDNAIQKANKRKEEDLEMRMKYLSLYKKESEAQIKVRTNEARARLKVEQEKFDQIVKHSEDKLKLKEKNNKLTREKVREEEIKDIFQTYYAQYEKDLADAQKRAQGRYKLVHSAPEIKVRDDGTRYVEPGHVSLTIKDSNEEIDDNEVDDCIVQ